MKELIDRMGSDGNSSNDRWSKKKQKRNIGLCEKDSKGD